MKQLCYYRPYDEILAIEHAARQAQATEMVRLASLIARKLKALTLRFAAALSRTLDQPPAPAAQSGFSDLRVRATLASIMEEVGASLPADLRARYAEELAATARVARMIDFAFTAWNFTGRTLAGVFQGIAHGLRAGAWSLDVVARRLTPAH